MEESYEKYLPLGTVCLLKGGQKFIMVTGYLGVNPNENNEVYDYMGVIFPMGIISTDINFMFNHSQIEKVVFKGFENDESKEFIEKIKGITKEDIINGIKAAQSAKATAEAPASVQNSGPDMVDMGEQNIVNPTNYNNVQQ